MLYLTQDNAVGLQSGLLVRKNGAVGLPLSKTLPRSAANSTVSNSSYIYQISHTECSWCALLIAAINPEANKTFM
jgi:hypothetical protein